MNVYVAAAGHSFVSQSGLVAVLKAVRKHGLPDAISRLTLKRRRADAIPQETPVGPLWGSIQLLCEGNSLPEASCLQSLCLALCHFGKLQAISRIF